MKTLLAVAVLSLSVLGIALAQNMPVTPVAPEPFPPPPITVVPSTRSTAAEPKFDINHLNIEQLIEHIGSLKAQRLELEKREAKAMGVLKERLRDANAKTAQLEGWQNGLRNVDDTKTELKKVEGEIRRPDEKK
jgi:hypothetical protein